MARSCAFALLLLLSLDAGADEPAATPSICYGTPRHGKLANSVALPESGGNFETFSSMASKLGRTHVHSTVAAIVADAYAALATELPDRRFVYGDTSWTAGGRMQPHRTHQNGTSVDFMVPVLDAAGKPAPLPTSVFNKFGYGLEFDASGRLDELRIDFVAIGAHLVQLDRAARRQGIAIRQVIFAPELIAKLKTTPSWSYLEQHIVFMKGKPWVRHDEHYHVDFAVVCQPMPTH